MLTVGSLAPDFTLSDHAGVTHTLSQYRGKRVVLYFYPKDDTPSCTAQACRFRDQLPHFSGLDAVVLGVSADTQRSHQKFARKLKLNFPLLTDECVGGTPSMIAAYGAWIKKSVSRTTYLIDAQGRIERVWQKVNPVYNSVEVLNVIRGLPAQEIEAKTPPMFIIEADEPMPVGRKVSKKAGKKASGKPTKKKTATAKKAKKAAKKAPSAKRIAKKSKRKASSRSRNLPPDRP